MVQIFNEVTTNTGQRFCFQLLAVDIHLTYCGFYSIPFFIWSYCSVFQQRFDYFWLSIVLKRWDALHFLALALLLVHPLLPVDNASDHLPRLIFGCDDSMLRAGVFDKVTSSIHLVFGLKSISFWRALVRSLLALCSLRGVWSLVIEASVFIHSFKKNQHCEYQYCIHMVHYLNRQTTQNYEPRTTTIAFTR